jgi:hypothetical protein
MSELSSRDIHDLAMKCGCIRCLPLDDSEAWQSWADRAIWLPIAAAHGPCQLANPVVEPDQSHDN